MDNNNYKPNTGSVQYLMFDPVCVNNKSNFNNKNNKKGAPPNKKALYSHVNNIQKNVNNKVNNNINDLCIDNRNMPKKSSINKVGQNNNNKRIYNNKSMPKKINNSKHSININNSNNSNKQKINAVDLFNSEEDLNNKIEPEINNNVINTIKYISENRLKYKNTNKMLREIGKIANNPYTAFLLEKTDDEPHQKLSNFLSDKMVEKNKLELVPNKDNNYNEDEYYENLQNKIKAEIKAGKKFDFNKLSEKDRKLLAQRKLYNKIGKTRDTNDNNNKDICIKEDKEIEDMKKKQRELLLKSIQTDDLLVFGEDVNYNNNNSNNNIKEDNTIIENNNKDNSKSNPTARDILEKVLKNIEYKNEILINHNQDKNIKIKNKGIKNKK